MLFGAVSAHHGPHLAIASNDLFLDLSLAGELTSTVHSASVPSDPRYADVIDDWLRSENIDPGAPIRFAAYTLTKFLGVHVQHDYQWGPALAPTGPNSFRVR
jgi:hypothetical protein